MLYVLFDAAYFNAFKTYDEIRTYETKMRELLWPANIARVLLGFSTVRSESHLIY